MPRLVSAGTQVKQLEGLLDTEDLTDWESGFVRSLVERTRSGADTRSLSAKQLESLERLWAKHFA